MSYEDLIKELKSNHLYPKEVIENCKCVGLEIYSPSIQSQSRLELVKSIAGAGYKINYLPNAQIITVVRQKKEK